MKHALWIAGMALVSAQALAGEAPKAVAQPTSPAFEKLKSLEGDWRMANGDGSVASSWKVTANGSAVVETLFPGSEHEMVTIFTQRGKDVHLTHYCAIGNQPEMLSDKTASEAKIAFAFAGGAGISPKKDRHMHSATLSFVDATTLREEWATFADGKQEDTKSFDLKRVPPPATKKP